MPEPNPSLNWKEIIARAVIPGILIAFTGIIGERVITSVNSKAENARLVTTLQIQREQAETDLRRDIFNQTVKALIDEKASGDGTRELSRQLLKLELLALNFGDSIRLAPLFTDFERGLTRHLIQTPADRISVKALRDRLWSLARRVASAQLSFLAQRGSTSSIQIELTPNGDRFINGKDEYKWPHDIFPDDLYSDPEVYLNEIEPRVLKEGTIELPGPGDEKVFVSAVFQNPDPGQMQVRVGLQICPLDIAPSCVGDDENLVERDFTLNYFNFPTIDNSRLPNNDRFAVVLDEFSLGKETTSLLKVAVVIFPSEYASLRDRPTMSESLELLERAQDFSPTEKEP